LGTAGTGDKKVNFGSLFAGIGGIDLGLERAGMTCVWQVEWDDYCQRVLQKHWPDVPKYGDIREIESLPYVDLIAGGFPCQPTSIAGKKLWREDERWLWPEFYRIICDIRPKYVLVENPTGIIYRGIGNITGDLASIGYCIEWDRIRAADFGAPHRRERIFFIAHSVGKGLERGIFSKTSREALGEFAGGSWWESEPKISRMVDGVPHRVDRLSALGNAVVPQVAEWIGRRIIEFDSNLPALLVD